MRRALGAAAAATLAGVAVGGRAVTAYRDVPPELRNLLLLPGGSIKGRRTLAAARRLAGPTPVVDGVEAVELAAAGPDGHRVPVIRHRPRDLAAGAGALLWMHGGGYIAGCAAIDNTYCSMIAAELGVVVVAVDYRLAPEHPFPAALDDCYAALLWLFEEAEGLGVDPTRIAVGGASAGGGLAAALCQQARDRAEVRPCFQLLRYPMLDDRTATRRVPGRRRFVWSPTSNRYGWTCYLGRPPRAESAPAYAAAARASYVGDLPPAWLGVGDIDLFHEEDVTYARRLSAAGVPVALHVEPGMYHGADGMAADAPSMRAFRERENAALRAAIGGLGARP